MEGSVMVLDYYDIDVDLAERFVLEDIQSLKMEGSIKSFRKAVKLEEILRKIREEKRKDMNLYHKMMNAKKAERVR